VFRTVRWLASAPDVDTKDALELATVDDQDPVEALAPDRADEALA
jgi:hypothetical protein